MIMDFIDLKAQQTRIRQKIDKRIKSVLDHGKYIMGPEVLELEEKLCDYVGVKYCISCSSGTDALLIPLMAKGLAWRCSNYYTIHIYCYSRSHILTWCRTCFVDVYESTYNLNPDILKMLSSLQKKRVKY